MNLARFNMLRSQGANIDTPVFNDGGDAGGDAGGGSDAFGDWGGLAALADAGVISGVEAIEAAPGSSGTPGGGIQGTGPADLGESSPSDGVLAIENAPVGSISEGVPDGQDLVPSAATDLGVSAPQTAPLHGASTDLLDNTPTFSGDAGGVAPTPAPTEPVAPPVKPKDDDKATDAAEANTIKLRDQLIGQRAAAAAGVTRLGNEADLLGFVRPKRKGTVRKLIGS